MDHSELLRSARVRAGLTVAELARRSGTSRTTLSAYENGRKAPTATTLLRILGAAGFDLTIEPSITFHEVPAYQGRTITVPDRLPQHSGLGRVALPVSVFWSGDQQDYDLTDPVDRKIAYEAVMTNGSAKDILAFIDADMLLEVFDDMYLPPATRAAWQPVVDTARGTSR